MTPDVDGSLGDPARQSNSPASPGHMLVSWRRRCLALISQACLLHNSGSGRELSASGIAFSAKILDVRRSPVMKNSKKARCFSLFLAVLCAKFGTREAPFPAQRVQQKQYQRASVLSI